MVNDGGDRPKYIRELADEALLHMFQVNSSDYTTSAIEAARAELAARGGIEQLRTQVLAQRNRVSAANTENESQMEPSVTGDPAIVPRFKGSGWGNGTKVLREETILNEWSMLLERAAEHWPSFLRGVHERLLGANIPGGCTWGMINARSQGWLARVHREFLLVDLEQFADYHIYIAARAYGIHLDCCRFLTVEPGFLKGYISRKLTGSASDALSAPRNILVHQDLRAWATVVHHAVIGSAGELMERLGQDVKGLHRGSRGILEIW